MYLFTCVYVYSLAPWNIFFIVGPNRASLNATTLFGTLEPPGVKPSPITRRCQRFWVEPLGKTLCSLVWGIRIGFGFLPIMPEDHTASPPTGDKDPWTSEAVRAQTLRICVHAAAVQAGPGHLAGHTCSFCSGSLCHQLVPVSAPPQMPRQCWEREETRGRFHFCSKHWFTQSLGIMCFA